MKGQVQPAMEADSEGYRGPCHQPRTPERARIKVARGLAVQSAGPHQPTQGWKAAPAKRQNSPASTNQAGHERNLGLAWASLDTLVGHPKGGDARGDPWPGVPYSVQGDPQRGRPQNPDCAQRAGSHFPGTSRSCRLGQRRRFRCRKRSAVRNQGKHERQRLRQPGTVLTCVHQPPRSSLEPQGGHSSQVAALGSHDLDAHPIGDWGTWRAERMHSAYNQPPHVGFHIGVGMADPPVPDIYIVK
jgi:hypothetical protein